MTNQTQREHFEIANIVVKIINIIAQITYVILVAFSHYSIITCIFTFISFLSWLVIVYLNIKMRNKIHFFQPMMVICWLIIFIINITFIP